MKAYYNDKANEAAKRVGVGKSGAHNGRRDAFRHAYTSALITYKYGEKAAKYTGDKVEKWGNNPKTERWMDERNNKIGREIGKYVKEHGGNRKDIAKEIKKSLDSNNLIKTPYDPRRTYEEHGDWNKAVKESKEALEHDRSAEKELLKDSPKLHDVDKKFDKWDWNRQSEIKRQEKDTLSNPERTKKPTIFQDKSVPKSPTDDLSALEDVNSIEDPAFEAKESAREMLTQMHSSVMQEIIAKQGKQSIFDDARQMPSPDNDIQKMINGTVNDPRNEDLFNRIIKRTENILKKVEGTEKGTVIAAKILEAMRKGNMKLQPNILVPNILPQQDGAARIAEVPSFEETFNRSKQPAKNAFKELEIDGLRIPITMPEIIIDEEGAVKGPRISRGHDGRVLVKAIKGLFNI